MVFARGDGIGLEITTSVIRGVRLDAADPGRVVGVAEVPIGSVDDQDAIFDALVRVGSQLGAVSLPTRVGWFPPGAAVQRLDVTGQGGPELNRIRRDVSERLGVSSTMLVDADARRWMLAVSWDHAVAWRLEELAERAGFVDVAVEPSPVALRRVFDPAITVARRDVSSARSWAVIYDGGVPLAAAAVDAGNRDNPGLAATTADIGLHEFDELLPVAQLADEVGRIAAGVLGTVERSEDIAVVVLGESYPPFPAHDLRAPQRVAVALGAAVGAAGLSGRLRPVDVTATRVGADPAERPWAVERVTDISTEVPRAEVPWWHRSWRKVARN